MIDNKISRRHFLVGLGALVATIAVIDKLPASETDRERILRLVRTGGRIENCEFVFHDGLGITLSGIHDLTISHCTFRWERKPLSGPVLDIAACKNVTIQYCLFAGRLLSA